MVDAARCTSNQVVLVLTASMGAGHDGVATELARRLRTRGYEVEVIDLLAVMPPAVGRALRSGYAAMLRWAPWLYDLIYRLWFAPTGGSGGPVSPVTVLAERRIGRWVKANRPIMAVSTFHLCSEVLARLARQQVLVVPSASIVVDPAVHRLWAHPDVDLHICLHPAAAAEARRRGALHASAPGPIVRPCFTRPAWDRGRARASLNLAPAERMVLMVAGSWGTGDIEPTLELVASSGRLTPVVVCGAEERLRRRLVAATSRQRYAARPRILGWVDDMDRLMAAADVVLENAGGLTAMEALGAGVPVVSFHPIPGHGRANVAAMAEAGLLEWVRQPHQLVPTLERASIDSALRRHLLDAAQALFRRDAVDDLLALIAAPQPARPPSDGVPAQRPGRVHRHTPTARARAWLGNL